MTDNTMTVAELREALLGYEPDTPVYRAVPTTMGTVLEPIEDLGPKRMQHDEYLGLHVVYAGGTSIIALE